MTSAQQYDAIILFVAIELGLQITLYFASADWTEHESGCII